MSRQQANSPTAESMDASRHQVNGVDTVTVSYPSPSAATLLHFQLTAFSPSHQTLTPSQPQTSAASYRMHESNPSEAPTPNNTPNSQNSMQQQQPRSSDHEMNQYPPPPQAYGTPSTQPQITMASSYPQPIALDPASGRFPHLHPSPAGGVRPQSGMTSPYAPGSIMPCDTGEANWPSHVVGSQGRRGILPSAPGHPAATPAGASNTKSTVILVKDANGKFPCPHCTKTYLRTRHLKRHLLRHTGNRPYMCVLCRDTFSRSDILKCHFQKCSIRRGNPTGASHLSPSGSCQERCCCAKDGSWSRCHSGMGRLRGYTRK